MCFAAYRAHPQNVIREQKGKIETQPDIVPQVIAFLAQPGSFKHPSISLKSCFNHEVSLTRDESLSRHKLRMSIFQCPVSPG